MKYRIAEWEGDAKPLRWLRLTLWEENLRWIVPISFALLVAAVAPRWLAASILVTILLGYGVFYLKELRRKDTRADLLGAREFLSNTANLPEFAVEMNLYYRGAWFGKDAGALSFVDGWLHFIGPSCSFSIAERDAGSIVRLPADRLWGYDRQIPEEIRIRVHYPAKQPDYAVAFRALQTGDAGELSKAFGDWIGSAVAPDSMSVFPPNVPLRPAANRLVSRSVGGAGRLLLAASSLLSFQSAHRSVGSDWATAVAGIYFFGNGIGHVVKAFRDAKILRRLMTRPLEGFPRQPLPSSAELPPETEVSRIL